MYDDDPVRVYLREMGRIPPMSREKELECARHIWARDSEAELAKKDLVEVNLAVVVSIAKTHPSDHIHILDLIQIGNEALFSAMRAFADSDADNFTEYARPFIENAIAHAVATPSC